MKKEKQAIEMRMDSVTIPEVRYSSEGYFYDTPILTRTGIFEYVQPDGSIRRELRRPEDVFDPESLASYEGKPVIITHSAQTVDTSNIHKEEVGCILTPGYQDGETVRAKIVLHDPDAVKASGFRELSLGYHLELIETPGELDGMAYDAIQTNIRVNHLALVAAARAGEDTRLNMDGKDENGGNSMDDIKKTTQDAPDNQPATVTTDAADPGATEGSGAPAVDPDAKKSQPVALDEDALKSAVKAAIADYLTHNPTAPAANADGCARKDAAGEPQNDPVADIVSRRDQMEDCQAKADINTLLSMLAAATARADAVESAAQEAEKNPAMNHDGADEIDARVRQRVELIRLGDRLNLDGMDTMPVDQAKRKVIQTVLPSMRLDGKTPEYIEAAYDMAREKAQARKTVDEQRRQVFNADSAHAATGTATKYDPDKSRDNMIRRHAGEET